MLDTAQICRTPEPDLSAARRSTFERVSSDPVELEDERHRLEQRSFWSRLTGGKPRMRRNDETAARCKLACLVAWMQSRHLNVPGPVLMVLSRDPAVWTRAAEDLARRRCSKDAARKAPEGLPPSDFPLPALDLTSALQLALTECEERTAPVTARTVSSVEDPFYIGYQRRRTLAAQLWLVAVVSFGLGCVCDFTHAWVGYRLQNAFDGTNAGLYPGWTRVVADYLVLPIEMLAWGLLGATLYLMRRLFDFTEARTFDHRLVEMYWVRLLMGGVAGAMLSLLIVQPHTPLNATEKTLFTDLSSHAIAIVGGFSVRMVYALIEQVSRLVRDQFERGSSRSSAPVRSRNEQEDA
jgi:hypothetical protein